jgi:hypothetical protein
MPSGIPVSDLEYGWVINFFRVLGAIAILFAIVIAQIAKPNERTMVVPMAASGIAVLVVNEIIAAVIRSKRRRVIDTGSGFRWLGGPADLDVRDDQVTAVRFKRTMKYSSGLASGAFRRFEVWVEGIPAPLRMTNRTKVGMSDPLAKLIDRIIADVKQRMAARLAERGTVEGDGWQLTAAGLTISREKSPREIAFGDIDKVAIFDNRLCIWLKGVAEPAARIDLGSKNAPILGSLLDEWVSHQEASGEAVKEPADAAGLGRLFFERRRNDGLWIGLLVGVLGAAAGFGLHFDRKVPFLVPPLLIAGGVAGVVWGLCFGRYVFRCYEGGLTRRTGRSERKLRYDEITEFSYSATRMFHNGAYTGTSFSFSFKSPETTIRYSVTEKKPDSELEGLRDHIAKVIASRMLRDLRSGVSSPWGTQIVIQPDGLRFRRDGRLFKSKQVEVVPFGRLGGMQMDKGVLFLFVQGEQKPAVSMQISAPNFFPGYYLVQTLLQQGQGAASHGESASA